MRQNTLWGIPQPSLRTGLQKKRKTMDTATNRIV